MPGLVERYFSERLGFRNIKKSNVLVEGTSDSMILQRAAELYYERYRCLILDDVSIIPAGTRNLGGVYNLNHRLHEARSMADADRDRDGRLQYQFIGLYDNDFAGREAIRSANIFNRSLIQYLNIFLLYPVMPCNPGEDYRVLGQRFLAANVQYRNIDWEIEDVLSEQLLSAFAKNHPNDVWVAQQARNRKHWEFSKDGKRLFSAYALANATLDDLWDVIGLLCALRSYLRLRFDHVACNIPTS